MQDKFSVLSEDERYRLDKEFKDSISGYDKVKINTKLIGSDVYSQDAWLEVIENGEATKMFYDLVERYLPDENNSYNKERYLRIALAFKEFITKPDINSFLCVLTKHPRYGDKYLDKKVLDEIFGIIAKRYNYGFNVKTQVCSLMGKNTTIKKTRL